MRQAPLDTLIRLSFNRTIQVLFKPFSLKKWFFLILIASLAGALGGGGGGGGNYGNFSGRRPQNTSAQAMSAFGVSPLIQIVPAVQASGQLDKPVCPLARSAYTSLGLGLALLVGLLVAGFLIFLTWVNARFKFVWFNAMVANDASVIEPFQRFRREGQSYFWFLLASGFGVLLFIVLTVGWGLAAAAASGLFGPSPQLSVAVVLNVFVWPGLVLLTGAIIWAIIFTYIEHFVVSIMAIEHCTFIQGWRKFMQLGRSNRKELLLYIIILMGLGIATLIAAGIVGIAFLILILLAAALLFGLPYLLIGLALKANLLYIAYAVIVGIPFFAGIILLGMSINLPFAVFFRNFSLYYLASLDGVYKPLALES